MNKRDINREVFMITLAGMWGEFSSNESVINAFHRVGVSKDGLSIHWMQKEKFKAAEALLSNSLDNDNGKDPSPTPGTKRRRGCTKASLEEELEKAKMRIEELEKQPITPDEIDGFFHFEKVRPVKTKNVRVTQVHGSLDGSQVLEMREKIEAEKKEKQTRKEMSMIEKETRAELFIKCRESCVCSKDLCNASGLKQCSSCKDVIKSHCSKAKCKKTDGTKPDMLIPACDKEQKRPRKSFKNVERCTSVGDDVEFSYLD